MEAVKFVAKSREEALNLVLKKLNANESEVVYNIKEEKGSLFKGATYECAGFLRTDMVQAVQDFLKTVLKAMDIDVEFEVSNRDGVVTIKMYSSLSAMIIGKNGQTLEALGLLVRQYVRNLVHNGPKILLDVEDYKERRLKRIESLAKSMAREVLKTKADVEMDSMNSYERRWVHSALSNFKGIKTESVGEEPNRCVVIKYVGE